MFGAMKAGRLTAVGAAAGSVLLLALAGAHAVRAQDEVPPAGQLAPANFDTKKLDIYYADPKSPNIAGFWRPAVGTPRLAWSFTDGTPLPPRNGPGSKGLPGQDGFPYTPAWQAAYTARRIAERDGHPFGDPAAMCWPQGMYKAYVGYDSPIEITETPGRVQMVHERLTEVRRIYTDGRGHPTGDALTHTAEGDSIGHWEGDTLVVDTIGLRKEFTLSPAPGLIHSDAMHTTERFTRVDANTLKIQITVEDPKALTRPVVSTLTYKLWLNDTMTEDFCAENNRNRPDANLVVQVDLSPRKQYGYDLPN